MGTDDKTVVVTGLGATTPLGGDVASTWSGMLAGKSGVRALTEDWVTDLPARIAGVAAVDPAQIVGRVQARRMDRCEQFAVVAAREAWADAGSPEVDPERLADDIQHAGNTSSASIPLALARMTERGELTSGGPVLLMGFGAGMCYAAQVITVP